MSGFVDLLAIVFLAVRMILICSSLESRPELDDSTSLYDLVTSRGYFVDSARRPDEPQLNFCISDHPFTEESMLTSSRCDDCGLSPAWKGIVRVHQIRSSIGRLAMESVTGKTRRWGNVFVAGDPALMDQLERLLRADRALD
jgi:hypothetical protein